MKEKLTFSVWLLEFFPWGLGSALMQASENINRLFENMNLRPWSLSGGMKEKDEHYKQVVDDQRGREDHY